MDSHNRNHIAHGVFWVNENNENPTPFTTITHQNIIDGLWKPRQIELKEHCLNYTKSLESQGKFVLCIWPEHCLVNF